MLEDADLKLSSVFSNVADRVVLIAEIPGMGETVAIEHVNESSLKLGCFQIYQCLIIVANATLALAISSSVLEN